MEILVRVPGVELWQVKDSVQELLVTTEWCISAQNSIITSKVGSVRWELNSDLHCLKASETSYVFAIDPAASTFYCLNLPQNVPEDDILVLETTLESFTTYEVELQPVTTRTDKLIAGIGRATSATVSGMATAAQYVGDKLMKGAEHYKKRSKPCKEPKAISEKTKKRVERVNQVAKMAAGMAGAAVDAVSVFTSKAADTILGTVNHDDPSKPASKAKRVTAAVFVSAAEIYDGMVDAFLIVSKKTASATKEVVAHKFGEEAGQVTMDGMSAVGHSANAFVQSTRLGTKAILTSTAKKTAMGYVSQDATALALPSKNH